jgi:hypothetical protein
MFAQEKRAVITRRDLGNLMTQKRCQFVRLVSHQTLLRVKATLPNRVLATCNDLAVFRQEESVLVATTDLSDL